MTTNLLEPSNMQNILKYLRARRNGASFSLISVGLHHEFNEWTPQGMCAEGASFFILREYLKITTHMTILFREMLYL